ncbi:MAG: DUF6531 domain-containing protein, partial [Gammaproteobacteria bacterium]
VPADGAAGVPADALIALRFSKPLMVKTVDAGSVRLSSPSGDVEAKIVPAEGGMLAFITPKQSLDPGTAYTVRIAGPLDQSYLSVTHASFTFTTAGERERDRSANPTDSEDWDSNGRDNWRTGRGPSQWQSLPPLQAAPGVTALAGQALKLNGEPLENVNLKIGGAQARTDATGRFLLQPLAAGHHQLHVEGFTADRPGNSYGFYEIGVNVVAGRTNALHYTIWMTRIDTAHAATIPSPTTSETVITTPRLPGLELRLQAGTLITDHERRRVSAVSITPVPVDRPPFPLPAVDVPIYFTIQPGGSYLSKPARLIYPNLRNSRPGTIYEFWNYDPEARGWYIYGTGRVEATGRQIIPDPGVTIYEFTGAMVAVPSIAPTRQPAVTRAADPVDLFSGLFVMEKIDVALADVIPINLTRTYRNEDSRSRPFGIGATHNYEFFLVGDMNPYTYQELILPDGFRIRYNRTSPGTSWPDAVYSATSSPGGFYGSTIRWNGNGWDLKLKDATLYVFPEAAGQTNPAKAAVKLIRDRYNNTITLTRDSTTGNLQRATSPNGRWVSLTYDASNRITQATDHIGRSASYIYDASGRLWKATDPIGGVTEYTYDTSHRMLTIKDAKGIVYLTNQYDANGRVTLQTQADNGTWQFAYTLDGNGIVTQTDVTDQRGFVRRVTFNSSGYPLTDTYAVGQPQQAAITIQRQAGSNFPTTVTDPLGRNTAYAYDSMG